MRLLPLCLALFTLGCATAEEAAKPALEAKWECNAMTDRTSWLPKGAPDGNEYERGNLYGLDVWWEGSPGLERALLTATLMPSRNPGTASNSGRDTLPDFYFEDELNPDWRFEGDDTEKIRGKQALRVSSTLKSGERVPLVISTFDWGGTFRIKITASPVE